MGGEGCNLLHHTLVYAMAISCLSICILYNIDCEFLLLAVLIYLKYFSIYTADITGRVMNPSVFGYSIIELLYLINTIIACAILARFAAT